MDLDKRQVIDAGPDAALDVADAAYAAERPC